MNPTHLSSSCSLTPVPYLHGDQVGSVLAVTNSSAQTVKRWGYTPYGQAVSYTATGDVTTPTVLAGAPEHGYVGQFGVMTDANGLLHMRARYYSPYLRRFLNEDPIGFGGGMNWFGYCGGTPLLAMDPSGLENVFEGDLGRLWTEYATDPKTKNEATGVMMVGTAIALAPVAYSVAVATAAAHPVATITAAAALDETRMTAAALGAAAYKTATVHHLATVENPISKAAGGPYTPKFEEIFSRFGVSTESAANKVPLPFHQGPHPELNRQVFDILSQSTNAEMFNASLAYVKNETAPAGSFLNSLATKLDASPWYQMSNFAAGSTLLRGAQGFSPCSH